MTRPSDGLWTASKLRSRKESSVYVYFPSCKFQAQYPETAKRIKAFLEERSVRVTGCCRQNYDKLAPEDQPITVCQTCRIIVGDNNPEQKPISLFEYLDALEDVRWPDHSGEAITVQDCFRALQYAEKTSEHELLAIRSLLRKMNYTVLELTGTEEERTYDGAFLYNHMMEGNLKLAPETFRNFEPYVHVMDKESMLMDIREYASRFDTNVVCYCNACAAGLKNTLPKEWQGYHLAELLFPEGA